MILKYKGILFDEFTTDADGHVWAEICESCAEKYKKKIKKEIDDGEVACGCCSVKGCSHTGNDSNKKHFYIDFASSQIRYITPDAVKVKSKK